MRRADGYRVSGIAVVTSLGGDLDHLLGTVVSGGAHGLIRSEWARGERSCWIGRMDEALVSEPSGLPEYESRNARITAALVRRLGREISALVERYGTDRIGVVFGSSTSGIGEAERMIRSVEESGVKPPEYRYAQQEMGSVAMILAALCGVRGPAYSVSTACSSSAKVFRSARALISMGVCDAVLVGGCDSLCSMTIEGFGSLDLLSSEPCNPFSKNRSGISIGEGAALFILERGTSGVQLLGIGESSDAYHMATPDPEGHGASSAMAAALADAELEADAVRYVNLHGTGTLHNDQMESRAMQRVFPGGVPCSSTKGYVGHLLGASGAVEIAIVCGLLARGLPLRLPVHKWDGTTDPELPRLDLVTTPRTSELDGPIVCMSNSFGFGGSNCSVLFGVSS